MPTTLTHYAKRHKVSKAAVTKWKARGWIVYEGEAVNVEASDANLKRFRKQPRRVTQAAVTESTKKR